MSFQTDRDAILEPQWKMLVDACVADNPETRPSTADIAARIQRIPV